MTTKEYEKLQKDISDLYESTKYKGYSEKEREGAKKFCLSVKSKLKQYKDAEEQGLLFRLLCKVGDVVYYFKEHLVDREVQPYQITNLMICCNKKGEWTKKYSAMKLVDSKTIDDRLDFAFEEIGIKVFLTKAEAEMKLAELTENRNYSNEDFLEQALAEMKEV